MVVSVVDLSENYFHDPPHFIAIHHSRCKLLILFGVVD